MDTEVVEYDPQWPKLCEDEKRRILDTIGNLIVAIEHIGSTVVPGLVAKPIIDIMAGVRRIEDSSWCIGPITYIWWRRLARFGEGIFCSVTSCARVLTSGESTLN